MAQNVYRQRINKQNIDKLRKLFTYLEPYQGKFVLGLLFLILSTFTTMMFPLLLGKLIDIAEGTPFWIFDTISSVVLTLAGVVVLQTAFAFARVYLFSVVSEKSMASLKTDLYRKMLSAPMTFFDESRTGDLMSRITADIGMLQGMFTTTLAELIRQIFTLVIGISLIAFLAPKLTVFMLAIFPVMIILAMIFGRLIRNKTRETQMELAKSNVVVEETLQGMNVVKSFVGEAFELNRYKSTLKKTVATAIKAGIYRAGFVSFIIPTIFGALTAIMWFGARQLQNGELDSGSLFSFVLIMGILGGSIAGLGGIFTQVQAAIGASDRVLEIMKTETEEGIYAKTEIEPLYGDVSFQSVEFSYPTRPDMKILDGLSIEIKKGEKVALVGKSGAGKSTIAQLLQSFYPISDGNILIDGKPSSEIGLKRLRSNIGIVPQEVTLFGGTIRENILYGKPEASEEEIRNACEQANADQFIDSFPEKLETIVGDRGVKLSGGQRQRIAIARAILKNPAILILDEATSSLDAESEHLVQQALENLMKGRTTIIIAHRLTTIKNADKILILRDGKIVESGTHDELLQIAEGNYSNLVRLQTEGADA
ncbi:MAG: ABC transporter transmembrane domain-containing protein [Cyclobacteriaceae bacterium]